MNNELIKRIDEHLVGFSLPCMESTDMAMLLKDCRAALSRKYVPMTDDERLIAIEECLDANEDDFAENLESMVIRRAGLEVQE